MTRVTPNCIVHGADPIHCGCEHRVAFATTVIRQRVVNGVPLIAQLSGDDINLPDGAKLLIIEKIVRVGHVVTTTMIERVPVYDWDCKNANGCYLCDCCHPPGVIPTHMATDRIMAVKNNQEVNHD